MPDRSPSVSETESVEVASEASDQHAPDQVVDEEAADLDELDRSMPAEAYILEDGGSALLLA